MTAGASFIFAARKPGRLAAVLAISVALAPMLGGTAEARLGGGGSFGSRGSRTFSMPSATPTAPRVSPLGRSQSSVGINSFGGARPGLFGGGFGRGLLGGFLGAGLFGLLFGHGLFGGLGGGFSLIGLLLQVGLIVLIFRFVMNRFRGQPAFGNRGGFASAFSGGGMGASQPQGPLGQPITIGADDYQVFEQRLVESQAAYSDRNVDALQRIATPQMVQNFSAELAGNARQGVINRLSDVRLLQGDLSEAWRENASDYATVAMRFSLIDAMIEERSGRVVAGNIATPQQVTEAWTFVRPAGSGSGNWLLSAIQQA